ncbi:hypothetical protein MKEN_00846000 [Mycena kentingensis (nom. inval.)]|nr:hypothetical protein MKEN_00846000 [Mycena kentingensis (nom. inval.)]
MSSSSASVASSTSASASPTSAAAIPIPSGCTYAPGSGVLGGGFYGCRSGNVTATAQCCANLGSAITFANLTCGCPYSASFSADTDKGGPIGALNAWSRCIQTQDNSTGSICSPPYTGSARLGSAMSLSVVGTLNTKCEAKGCSGCRALPGKRRLLMRVENEQ